MFYYIGQAFKHTFYIKGRSRRKEFWFFTLFEIIIIFIIFGLLYGMGIYMCQKTRENGLDIDTSYIFEISALFVEIIFLPTNFSLYIRRLHDSNKSGFWILLLLIPLLHWIPFIFTLIDSDLNTNRFGSNPKIKNELCQKDNNFDNNIIKNYDNNDIEYYYYLLQKGIITEEEFIKIKKKLIKII